MGNADMDFFSSLYIHYYYGSYTRCRETWKEYHISCPYSKLYYIRKGECELVIEGNTYHALPGMLFFIPAHTQHSYYHINDNHVEKYWMHFDLKTGESQTLQGLGLPYCVSVPEDNALDSQFQEIISLSGQMDPASRIQEKAAILNLFATYLRLSQASGFSSVPDAASSPETGIQQVIQYMNLHLSERLSVSELAGLLHVHPNYFIRLFKTHMGMPPLRYRNMLRAERAKSLLENTALPVSEIMRQVGFEDSSTFSRFFKHYTGYNPMQFRKTFSDVKPQKVNSVFPSDVS